MKTQFWLLMATGLFATQAHADVRVEFREGAPKDRFIVTNMAGCDLQNATLTVDLSGSSGGLIFDVTSAGQGVEVFQPFEIEAGGEALARVPQVDDGQTQVVFSITNLAPSAQIVATTDVDDTASQRGITVRGDELSGTRVSLTSQSIDASATFQSQPSMVLPSAC